MSKSKKHVLALFFILQLCSPVFAGFLTDNDKIWQASANEFIQYIDQDSSSSGNNDHPVVLQAKDIKSILASIKYQQQKDIKAIFTDQQTDLLSRYLEQGLKVAKPNQDIIFVMEKSVKRFTLLKPARYFVAGRVFYKNNKLNIIIGDFDRLRNEAYEAANDPTGTGHIHYSFDYGKRSKPSMFKKAIVSLKGVEQKQLNNTSRHDWLVIDVNVASKAIKRMSMVRNREEMAEQRKKLIEVLGSENTMHIEAKKSPEKATHSIEERLIELKNLRNKDLITEKEYSRKRQLILDDL